ncbi:hypothetical protein SAMN05421780_106121 [Flexibacter flexilis DSM 6793]|uniref:DUF4340 domain-containing protein n=1 Tax=Flexibacter flexilis DSM 6793 TaxID=927664 RepID=A0A1I1JUZ0_9BACT|nr:hypothetical protein [Flexibacter flexilis]SFC52499.1 hypothetical protein SAMN05421780_106121 [Flexibacter flexilis DSM 6793]
MKNKNIIIGFLAVIILGGLAYLAWNKSNKTSTVEDWNADFAVRDTASITKIFISEKSGKTFTIKRQANSSLWTINDSILAQPGNISLLLKTIRSVKMRRPLAKAERPVVIKEMASRHKKVEIYSNEKLLKTYYVGGEPGDLVGSYFLLEGSETPYVAYVPSFNGFISIHYRVEFPDWRYSGLFTSTPRSLQKISVQYPQSPKDNFTILSKGNHFELMGVSQPLDSAKFYNYLSLYRAAHVEAYWPDFTPHKRDSVYNLPKYAIISVEDIDKAKSHTVELSLPFQEGAAFLGLLDDKKEIVTLQYRVATPLLVSKSYFLKNQPAISK